MRKLARVGRPPSRDVEQRADVGQPQRVEPSPRRRRRRSAGQLALELRQLPRVVGRHVGQRADARRAARPSSRSTVAAASSAASAAVEPVDQLGQPAGEVDVAAADVVERQRRAEVAVVVAAHRDAEQHPVEAGPPGVVRRTRSILNARALPASRPQRTPASATQPATRSRSSSSKPNRRRHRLGAGQVEHLGGGDPAAGELDQRRRRPPSSGLVLRSARSASRTRSRWAGCAAAPSADHVGEPEAGRDQRRVGLDVGAHHEDVARLEGRVVLEQPDQHLAQHVDLAGRAVAGVHLHAAVGRRRARGRRARRRRARGWRAGRAAASRAGCRPPVDGAGDAASRRGSRRARGAARGRRGRARRAAGGRRSSAERVVGRAATGPAAVGRPGRPRAPARPAAARGARRGARRARASSSTSVTGSRVWPNSDSRAAGRARRRRSRSAASVSRVPHVGRRLVDPRRAAAATARPASAGRRSSGPPAPSVSPPVAPVGDQGRALHGVRREQRRPAGGRRSSGGCGAARASSPSMPVPEVGGERRAPRLAEASRRSTSSSGQTSRSGSHGSSRSRPSSSETSERGLRNRDARADAVAAARARRRAGGRAAGSATARRPGPAPPRPPAANGSSSGVGEQLAEPVGEQVGARGAVQVERHRGHPKPRHRQAPSTSAGAGQRASSVGRTSRRGGAATRARRRRR